MIFPKQGWSVFILCYNEKESLRSLVANLSSVLVRLASQYEIILIDDCSSDGSQNVIEALCQEQKEIRAIYHARNLGIGPGLRDGYREARYENVVMLPGDGQFDPTELLMAGGVSENEIVFYVRTAKDEYTWFRHFLTFVSNRLVNQLILGIKVSDVNWVKVYKRKAVQSLNLSLTSSLVESEIVGKLTRLGLQYRVLPSKYLPRRYGQARGGSWLSSVRALRELFRLVYAVKFLPLINDKKPHKNP